MTLNRTMKRTITNKKKFVLIGILLCFLYACIDEKEKCVDELLSTKHFETEFGCIQTRYNLFIDLHNTCTIIRSKATYDELVSGICHPEIDFSNYDLVIGKQATGNLNDTVYYDYRRVCPDMDLTLTIDVVTSAATQPSNITYHALIPKLGDEESIDIIVNVYQ